MTTELAGLTVCDVARRYRVSRDKVRQWIRRGELGAINTGLVSCGKRRYVILPDHLAAFEKRRAAVPPHKPPRRRKRKDAIDYFPD